MNKEEFNIKLGQTIRESRLAQSISQEKLAYLAASKCRVHGYLTSNLRNLILSLFD